MFGAGGLRVSLRNNVFVPDGIFGKLKRPKRLLGSFFIFFVKKRALAKHQGGFSAQFFHRVYNYTDAIIAQQNAFCKGFRRKKPKISAQMRSLRTVYSEERSVSPVPAIPTNDIRRQCRRHRLVTSAD